MKKELVQNMVRGAGLFSFDCPPVHFHGCIWPKISIHYKVPNNLFKILVPHKIWHSKDQKPNYAHMFFWDTELTTTALPLAYC